MLLYIGRAFLSNLFFCPFNFCKRDCLPHENGGVSRQGTILAAPDVPYTNGNSGRLPVSLVKAPWSYPPINVAEQRERCIHTHIPVTSRLNKSLGKEEAETNYELRCLIFVKLFPLSILSSLCCRFGLRHFCDFLDNRLTLFYFFIYDKLCLIESNNLV